MDKITHKVRREQWTKIVTECLASGMNKTAWCREQGISVKSFFYWQRRLREDAYLTNIEASCPPAVHTPTELPTQAVDFIELKAPEHSSDSSKKFQPDVIIRKGEFSIELSNTTSPELLRMIGGLLNA